MLFDASYRYRSINQTNANIGAFDAASTADNTKELEPRRPLLLVLDGDAELQPRGQVQRQRQPERLDSGHPARLPGRLQRGRSVAVGYLLQRHHLHRRLERRDEHRQLHAATTTTHGQLPRQLPRREPPHARPGAYFSNNRENKATHRQRLGRDHQLDERQLRRRRRRVLPRPLLARSRTPRSRAVRRSASSCRTRRPGTA